MLPSMCPRLRGRQSFSATSFALICQWPPSVKRTSSSPPSGVLIEAVLKRPGTSKFTDPSLDHVRSAWPRLHERYRREIGRVEDGPTDRLAELSEQIGWLREVGFSEVDCHFEWLELSMIVAVK